MKKTTLILFFVLSFVFCSKGYAQAPLMFNYQAVLRDGGGQLLINQQVQIRISILQNSSSGPEVFSETHTPTTNDNGLIAILVGSGVPVNGNISNINWGNGTYYLKSEVDPTGVSNYTLTSTQQLLSVPYALFSNGGDYTNLINKPDIPDIVNTYFEAHHLVDTIYVMNMGYDTVYTYVHDTVFTHIYDTIHAYHQDTINTYHFDTTFTHSFDTIHAYHQDTLNTYHFDTTFTHTYDTVHTYHQDTVSTYHFDTVYNRTYDTTYTHSYDTVHEISPTSIDTAYVDSVMANYHETQGLPEVVAISNSAANHQIKDVENPTAPMDAVNKRYFDSVLAYVCNRYDSILNVFQHRIDSLDTVIASLTPCVTTHSIDNQEACDSYTWMDGITYTASTTTPTFTTTNIAGCDSVITLHLTINHGTHTSDSVTASISYTWHDTTYTASGTYTYNYLDANGCSSTDTLHLTINTNVTLSTPFYVEDVSGSTNTLHIVKFTPAAPSVTLDYSYDGSTWTTWGTTSTTALSLNIPANSRVYLRANTTQYGNSQSNHRIYADRDFAICGNIHSLLQKTNFDTITHLPKYVFKRLFSRATHLKSAENLLLPASTLAENCYFEMFNGCSSLINAPALPATTLAKWCYRSMFFGCTSLISTPTLPATTLDTVCYGSMFVNCTSLINAPTLSATTLAICCYSRMFDGCTSLTNAPDLPATTLVESCYESMFAGCSSLINAPALPATTLDSSCYKDMFAGCASLSTAPDLHATTLAERCYSGMFQNCSSLINAPALPATTLARSCYFDMFSGCTSLTNAPVLPATTLAEACYGLMFDGCTSLTNPPDLPAISLANLCYYGMFSGCTSLSTVSDLPATTLAEQCYYRMFYGCTDLTIAPELPATTLTTRCYEYMFYGCSNLQQIKVAFTYWNTNNTSNWTYGLPATGTFVCPTGLPHTMNSAGNNSNAHYIPYNWTIEDDSAPVSLSTPFCVENMSVLNNTLHIIKSSSSAPTITLDYSYDGSTWTTWGTTSTTALSLNIPANSRVYLRANATRYGNSGSINRIYADNDFAICGNIHSLLQKTNFDTITQLPNSNVFRGLFDNATRLKSAENLFLPATSLTDSCYNFMFMRCYSLTEAPELPATTLARSCYEEMFSGCTSLTEAPELPASTLAHSCYNEMFFGCHSLTEAPELPATTLAEACYLYMFNSCTSLINAPALPATTLAQQCYYGMFLNCTSLINAPALPATTLAELCYQNMFSDCTSLTNAPVLPATTLAEWCYRFMFSGCTALTVVPAILPATTLAERCYEGMFSDCTTLTIAPELPATTLTTRCYQNMFYNCFNLQYIKVAFTNWRWDESSTGGWTRGLPATGTFVCPTGLSQTMNSEGNDSLDASYIPYNWTITTY